ncbi:FAD-dependent oxidoreductase [Micromonospora sp. NPDC007208]|uniref:FAD-binding oxidoreductase n=1 Tax=Micromonospora sp. NPDC007208 TaxID=3364236 RepID=UPI00367CD4D2
MAGEVYFPHDPAYEHATTVFNLHGAPRPAAARTVRTLAELRDVLAYARTTCMPVRVHSTGHGAAAAREMSGSVLVRTEMDGAVQIDPVRRTALIPAGTRWGAVVDAAAPFELAAPHGSSADVGAVGYLLRGGVSVYGRLVGLAANSVTALDLVTADGELHRVDADHDPELFWALRGGGGGFGVVVAVEIRLFPARPVVTGSAYWPVVHAAELLRRWTRWAATAPWEVTSAFQVLNLPDVPMVPVELRSGTMIGVAATEVRADDAPSGLTELLDELRAVAAPVVESWLPCTPAEVVRAQLGPDEPVPIVGDHLLLADLDERASAAFLAATGSGSPLITAELRQLGGALAVPDPRGGALDHYDARYSYLGNAIPDGPEATATIEKHCAVVRAALAPWDTGRTAPTFVESWQQPQRHLDPEQIDRADRVRTRVDPTGLFRLDASPGTTMLR